MSELFEKLRIDAHKREIEEQKDADRKVSQKATVARMAALQNMIDDEGEEAPRCGAPPQPEETTEEAKEKRNLEFRNCINDAVQEIFKEMSKDYRVRDVQINDEKSYFDPNGASFVYFNGFIDVMTSFDKSEPKLCCVGSIYLNNNKCRCTPFFGLHFETGPFNVLENVGVQKPSRRLVPHD